MVVTLIGWQFGLSFAKPVRHVRHTGKHAHPSRETAPKAPCPSVAIPLVVQSHRDQLSQIQIKQNLVLLRLHYIDR